MNSVVKIDSLYWKYPTFTGFSNDYSLKNVNLEIKEGEFFGISGPTGSGKTTLCFVIAGLIPHQMRLPPGEESKHFQGKVEVLSELTSGVEEKDGNSTITGRGAMSPDVGLVMQDPESQFLTMSALSELSIGLQMQNLDRKEMESRIKEALNIVGLSDIYATADKIHPSELSGGQKQRLVIASFLAMKPKILILDEPTSDLDPAGKAELIEAIENLKEKSGITVILVEHDPEVMLKFADRMAVISKGEIVAVDKPEAIYRSEEMRKIIEIPQVMQLIGPKDSLNDEMRLKMVKGFKPTRNVSVKGKEIISIKNLEFSYEDGTRALNGLDLSISDGEFVALIGQNGSGKSTMSKVLAGFQDGWIGRVFIEGKNLSSSKVRKEMPRHVGYVFQNPDHQIFNRTVKDEILYGLKNIGLPEEEQKTVMEDTLKRVHLFEKLNEDPIFLSRGEKRRLAVASVMAMKPEILIVDEPTTGQDYRMSRGIMDVLTDLNKTGTTVIVITHDMRLVAEYTRRTVVMRNGKIIFDGSAEILFQNDRIMAESSLAPPQAVRVSRKLKDSGILNDILLNAKEWIDFFKFENEKKNFVALKYGTLRKYAYDLSRKILEDYGKPKSIVYIERGGMFIGRLLSDLLAVREVYPVRASYYTDDGLPMAAVQIGEFEHSLLNGEGYVLLVDDIADSGRTLEAALQVLKPKTPRQIVTATVVYKPRSVVKPDVYAYVVDNDTWIVFDYEQNETTSRFLRKNNEEGLSFMKENFEEESEE